jgi:hypothetical protein
MQATRMMIVMSAMVGFIGFVVQDGWAAEAEAASDSQVSAIACAFELSVLAEASQPVSPAQKWYFWRQPERVEKQDVNQGTSEIWRRGRDGQIFYERAFHRDQRLIEFVPGDLRALKRYPDWHQLVHVIKPSWLQAQLQHTGTTTILARPAQRYRGRINDTEIEVLWLEGDQIPALVREKSPKREVVLRLRDIYPLPTAPWPRVKTDGYQRIDYADLGDRHNDPWVRRIEQGERHTPDPLHPH